VQWQALGRVPNDKRYIDGKFQKTIDSLLTGLNVDKTEAEMIKYQNKLDGLNNPEDTRNLDNERNFIRKKIDEVKGQINQLENNLQFFTNVEEDNPLVKDVHTNIKKHREALQLWIAKLQKIKELY
jgi:vacuolar-type H+-ATPase subunit I/STV1